MHVVSVRFKHKNNGTAGGYTSENVSQGRFYLIPGLLCAGRWVLFSFALFQRMQVCADPLSVRFILRRSPVCIGFRLPCLWFRCPLVPVSLLFHVSMRTVPLIRSPIIGRYSGVYRYLYCVADPCAVFPAPLCTCTP